MKSAHRTQNTWEKECFSLPVAGIEGDINHHIPVERGSRQTMPFLQWLLQQNNRNSKPFLWKVEHSNNYKYFFVTTYQQRHEATTWVDGLNDMVDDLFTLKQRMAIFGSERANLRCTNRSTDEPRRTPVDEAYLEVL